MSDQPAAVESSNPQPGLRVAETPEQVRMRVAKCITEIGEVLAKHDCDISAVPGLVEPDPVGTDGAGLLIRAVARVNVTPKRRG